MREYIPLSLRMMPRNFDEFVGQKHILGEGKPLRTLIERDAVSSMVFYGPPGVGKSAVANIIASKTGYPSKRLNAAIAGIKELKPIVLRAVNSPPLMLFIDEVHRFNRLQQDVLLPYMEDGTVIVIGTTTENPFFELNRALISRLKVFEFKNLSVDELRTILKMAVSDRERGLGNYVVTLEKEAEDLLILLSGGDARGLLNALEMVFHATVDEVSKEAKVDVKTLKEVLQMPPLWYDKDREKHYQFISAFIKSMRGSDPDATIYWLVRMAESGEDVRFIARRIAICAAEDVGLADPIALVLASAAMQSADVIGWPEAILPLGEAAIYIATAPKSNSVYKAVNAVKDDIKGGKLFEVPLHLRGPGMGKGYLYPHDYVGHWVKQKYLPESRRYYEPTIMGYEKRLRRRIDEFRRKER